MATVSDAVYSARPAAASYVSSSAYYGYVPPCTRESGTQHGHHWTPRAAQEAVDYGSPMETDEDGCERVCSFVASRRIGGGRCAIPEAPSWHRFGTENGKLREQRADQQQQQQQLQQQQHADTPPPQRGNRKRSYGDRATPCQLKRFREGSAKDYGSAEVLYDPTPLRLNAAGSRTVGRPAITIESCCRAAGNHSFISNADCKRLLSRNDSKSPETGAEYERMLFETHGCSAYHHHRQQHLQNDNVETEF